jgi:hypothetical protein
MLGYMYFAARSIARGLSCLGNINQVGLSVRMYSQDYDDRLPPFAYWMDNSYPYVKVWTVFHCPEVRGANEFGYGINNRIDQYTKIKHPDTYPLIYDSGNVQKNAFGPFETNLARPYRHHGEFDWVSYADGHYKTWPKRD